MALRIDGEIERLAKEIAELTGESETETIRSLLLERRQSLEPPAKRDIDGLMRWLREEVWPTIPGDVRGKPISKDEWDALNDEESL